MALTTAQATQDALNIAVSMQNSIQNGVYEDVYDYIFDLCAAVNLLAEIINANASALSSTVTPTSINIGTQYSVAQSTTAPIKTIQR